MESDSSHQKEIPNNVFCYIIVVLMFDMNDTKFYTESY